MIYKKSKKKKLQRSNEVISNVGIYDLEESLVASGYPKRTKNIIHDLKTPTIAQIKALESFLVTCSNKISQEEVDLIKLTLSSCNYMHKLIDIFTSVHKLNFEKISLTYENFNIVKLAKDVCFELGILLKYRKLEYEFICPDEIMINADKLQLKRVMENIFSNCINHSFPDSKITVYIFEKNKNLIFKVKNSSLYIEKRF